MRKLNLILAAAFIALSIIGCTNETKEQPKAQEEKALVEDQDQDHEETEAATPIEFNNNEKWLVNNEMKPFVTKGSTLVDEYIASGKSDYQTLVTQLKDQNKQLISSCTMKGKSHDELHKWLAPHLKLVSDLEKTTNEAEAKELIVKLKSSYTLYDKYFQ